MRLVHLVQKTDILKYQTAEYNDPLDYMRAAIAAIRSGQPSSNCGSLKCTLPTDIDTQLGIDNF